MPPRRRMFPPPTLSLSTSSSQNNLDQVGQQQAKSLTDLTTIPGTKLKAEDIQVLEELGAGAGGSVHRVQHKGTGAIMARKIIFVEAEAMMQSIRRELEILQRCQSQFVVSYYGLITGASDISLFIEHMDRGSLATVRAKNGRIPENILGEMTASTLDGLVYLYKEHKVMHRDIKPSNILVNSEGSVKICDFGVSGIVTNSVANTFVGTQSYMAPERISGQEYSVQADVWALGLTLIELAWEYPYPEGLALFELLQCVVTEAPPDLPDNAGFSPEFRDFVQTCLTKDVAQRPRPVDLLEHPFIKKHYDDRSHIKTFVNC